MATGLLIVVAAFLRARRKVASGAWTDKEAHCYVSCKAASYLGPGIGIEIGLLGELVDEIQFRLGTDPTGFDWQDMLANAKGVACGQLWLVSCEDCCT